MLPTRCSKYTIDLGASIVDYDLGKGELLLEHAYPIHAHPVPRISVDINLVLESTHSSALQQGSWINVIGYTRVSRTRGRPKKQSLPGTRIEGVSLQAILIWSAGSLRIGEYEATLEEQRLLQQRLKSDSM